MKGIPDLEMGAVDDDTTQADYYRTKVEKQMGIEIATTPSGASKESVEQVDNNSNFVFSSFHDLNLFVILQLENELVHARKKLYDADGLPQKAKDWTDEDTVKLQIHLKRYRTYLQFAF